MPEATLFPAMLVDVLARGVAVGAFAACGLALAAGRPLNQARLFGILFFSAAIGHTLDNCHALAAFTGPGRLTAHTFSVSGAVLFWAFVTALFTDEPRPIWRRLWPAGIMAGLALVGPTLPWPARGVAVMGGNLFSAAFVLLALLVIARGWRGDLVDARRRLRAPVMGAAAAYVLLMAVGDVLRPFGSGQMLGSLPQAIALAVLALMGVTALLKVDPVLLEAVDTRPASAPVAAAAAVGDGLDPGDRITLDRLAKAMDEDEVWRRETLTVGGLAALVGAPEHRLRRLINGRLGHRNFAAFINARRIEAAKAELGDPQAWRKPVSSIAYDLGFGSLGPFNRAFKDATGMTPSAWRQNQGASANEAEGSPISERAA
jgi:AraC-like DNA-binding protein